MEGDTVDVILGQGGTQSVDCRPVVGEGKSVGVIGPYPERSSCFRSHGGADRMIGNVGEGGR